MSTLVNSIPTPPPVEFTLTTPGCLDTLADFRTQHGNNLLTVSHDRDEDQG